ncbi:MAG: transcriptional regulator [Candidatus Omnitrophica bacterium]|nr:transcriptional regulator [Candidatus Omnitrophota bacterium]
MSGKEMDLMSFFKKRGGLAGYSEILKAGFDKVLIKSVLNSGRIQKIDRALYRLSDGSSLSNPDLVAISIKVPKGIICLLSALAFHEATNEVPRYVDVAILRGTHANKIKYPPVRFYRFSDKTWKAGIEEHRIEGHNVRIYSLSKAIVDCFKFRNKIGIDVARSALKVAVMEKGIKPKDIMQYAKICRVGNIIKPIVEAII